MFGLKNIYSVHRTEGSMFKAMRHEAALLTLFNAQFTIATFCCQLMTSLYIRPAIYSILDNCILYLLFYSYTAYKCRLLLVLFYHGLSRVVVVVVMTRFCNSVLMYGFPDPTHHATSENIKTLVCILSYGIQVLQLMIFLPNLVLYNKNFSRIYI